MGGAFSWWHIAIVVIIVLLLFGGRGKLSGLMGDAAKGIRAFKDGLKGDDSSSTDKAEALPRTEREKEEVR